MAKVAVVYYSKSGNTKKMAQLVADGCREVSGTEVAMMELPKLDMDVVLGADGYCLGSPDYFSYMAGYMKTFFDDALAYKGELSGRPYVAFGTHGGGAKVLDSLERLSEAIGLKHVRPGMMCANAPGPGDEDGVRGLGHALAEAISK